MILGPFSSALLFYKKIISFRAASKLKGQLDGEFMEEALKQNKNVVFLDDPQRIEAILSSLSKTSLDQNASNADDLEKFLMSSEK